MLKAKEGKVCTHKNKVKYSYQFMRYKGETDNPRKDEIQNYAYRIFCNDCGKFLGWRSKKHGERTKAVTARNTELIKEWDTIIGREA